MAPLDVAAFLFVFLAAFIEVMGGALTVVVIIRVLLSWVPQLRLPPAIAELVFGASEAVLGPIRRVLPSMGGFDLSPLVAIVGIRFVQSALLSVLAQLARAF